MEHSLTPRPSRSKFQRQRPSVQSPLSISSSISHFEPQLSLREALNSLPSHSTPDLRQHRHKKSVKEKFVSGLKSLFRRNTPQPTMSGTEASMQQDIHNNTIQTLEDFEDLAEHGYAASITDELDKLSIDTTQMVTSPSALMVDQFESKVDSKGDSLTPAAREAARLGLELDFSRPNPTLESPDTPESVVRAYKDLGSDYYALRDVKPVYDGNAISSGNAHHSVQRAPEPIGMLRCCKCDRTQELYQHNQGQHIISVLNCVCPHRSCENCTLTGNIKLYKPVQEPFPVQLSDGEHKQVKFGVFCGNCGLSWRAQIAKDSVLQKISAVPKDLAKRGAHPIKKLRESRSMSNLRGEPGSTVTDTPTKSTLNLRALSNEMEKEHGKQANSVMVQFSGIQCTCGCTLNASSLCFQIVEPFKKEVTEADAVVVNEPRFTATLEDKARGIGLSTLKLTAKGRTFRHANPLMSNPVTEEDLAMFRKA